MESFTWKMETLKVASFSCNPPTKYKYYHFVHSNTNGTTALAIENSNACAGTTVPAGTTWNYPELGVPGRSV